MRDLDEGGGISALTVVAHVLFLELPDKVLTFGFRLPHRKPPIITVVHMANLQMGDPTEATARVPSHLVMEMIFDPFRHCSNKETGMVQFFSSICAH